MINKIVLNLVLSVLLLQVMNRQTRKYEPVIAPPGGVIVNIGDMMQRWTSDDLVANVSTHLIGSSSSRARC